MLFKNEDRSECECINK